MSLLYRIKNYGKETCSINDQCILKLNSLKNIFTREIDDINYKIGKLNEEKNSCLTKVAEVKKNLKSKIIIECQRKAYEAYGEIISTFDLADTLISKDTISNKTIQDLKSELLSLLRRVKEINEKLIPQLEAEKENRNKQYKSDVEKIQYETKEKIDKIRIPLKKDYLENVEHNAVDFNNASMPNKSEDLPSYVTIGNYIVQSNNELKDICNENPILLPIDLDTKNNGNIIVKIDSNHLYDNNQQIEKIITGLAMRYIESFPSGHLKLGIYSSSLTSFGRLSALFTAAARGKISILEESCKTKEQFSKLLLSISQKGEMINSKLLENGCTDLYELYDKDIKTEDFQLVIVHDAFKEMTIENINQFHGCVSELSKCGIRFIIVDDFNEELYKNKPSSFMNKLNQILECGNVFNINNLLIKDSNGNSCNLISCNDISQQKIYEFINTYCNYSSENKAPYLSYEKVGFGKYESDKSNFESIIIPVALSAPDVWNIEFDIVGKSPNANLIVGIPGTGKSTLIDSLIMNGSMKYSPDELTFQLLDFKDGISSSVYTMEECKIPHVKVVSQNNKPEEAEIILSNILAESERRNKEFMSLRDETNEAIRNIVEYNKLVSSGKYNRKNMPRLIIVIDECQYLFEEESLAKKCQDIVRKCRSQGIHLILATQTLSHKMWNTIKFVEGIYCFEIAKDDAEQLLDRKYVSLISSEIPKGSYMAFASNNNGHDCSKIKIAFDGGNTSKYSARIRNKWSDYKIDLVTIGDKSQKVINKRNYISLISELKDKEIPLGENYNDHRTLSISYEKKRPMFLAGTNQKAADSILELVTLTAAVKGITTYLIDASADQELNKFAKEQANDYFFVGDEKNYIEYLHIIYKLYKEREINLRAENKPIFFIVNSLQNIVDFLNNRKEDSFDESNLTDDSSAKIDYSKLSMKEIIALSKKKQSNQSSSGITVFGRETLVPFLMSNAYKANIFICVSLDSVSLTNDSGEQVFGYSHRNIIRTSDFKILYPNCNSDIRNIMDDSFKEKMLNGLSENMAFMSFEQREFYKFRFFQLERNK